MEITKIKGDSYYIKGGTNAGIYIFEDKTALMIDPGLGRTRPKRMMEVLDAEKVDIKYIINTHEHNDHYGACNSFKSRYKGLEVLCTTHAKMYIENPDLFSKYIMGGRSNIFLDGYLKDDTDEEIHIDRVVEEGFIQLNNVNFEIIELPGHTPGSIGIQTKDKVIFIGDVLVSNKLLKKYDFLFIYDIEKYLESLQRLKKIDFEFLVLGHGKEILSKEDSNILINNHEQAIKKYIDQTKILLTNSMTLENLLKEIINHNKLSYNYKEYHYLKSSLVSVISYLSDKNEIDYILKNGELLYYTKKK